MSDFEQAVKPAPAAAPKSEPVFPEGLLPKPPRNLETPAQRIAAFPTKRELGEQIVDSAHEFELVRPRITAREKLPATAIVSIAPAEIARSRPADGELQDRLSEQRRMQAFSPVAVSHEVRGDESIPLKFWPRFGGDHEADVNVLLRWSDDVVDQRTIRVHGRARRLNDAPETPLGETSGKRGIESEPQLPTADLSNVREIHKTGLSNAYELAKVAVGGLARAQLAGLTTALKEADSYERKPPKATWWDTLAEFAITAAIGSVANVASKAVGAWLAPKLAKLEPLTGLQKRGDFSKYTDAAVTDGVKDALKLAGKKALIAGPKGTGGSSNGMIAFFETQQKALNALIGTNEAYVVREHERLQHLLVEDPERAIAIMSSLEHGFGPETQGSATNAQTLHSVAQWISVCGRSENGSEAARVNGEQRGTTKLNWATGATRGVLRIRAKIDGHVVSVTSASMDGVSQEIGDRMRTQDLSTLPIPIVILATGGGGTSFITRDEVGRVRVSGRPDHEAQNHRDSQELCDRVLAKTLDVWGVKHVVTDDATGRDG
jgi:hypothetical protein